MTKSFQELGLTDVLVEALKKANITIPTDIQTSTIPLALDNRDIIGQSQTGSGKTLAYLLPIFQRIAEEKREMQCIILAPTHELVMQIDSVIKLLSKNSGKAVTSTTIIGEVNVKRQIEKLKEKPHIIVGSPGRILELIRNRKITAHTVKTIVIDEGDRLLDENNLSVVKDVIKTTLRDRQLMTFSATINENILKIAKNLMKEPELIKIEEDVQVNPNIDHVYITTELRDKIEVLRKLISAEKPAKAIVFINKSEEIELTTLKLQYHQIKAYGIYGSAAKEERKKALEDFRNGKIQILVASDLAARGLDVKGVTHIINLDLPKDSKEYIHRVGRTGRANMSGIAISIVTSKELLQIRKFENDLKIQIQPGELHKGSLVEPYIGRPSNDRSYNHRPSNGKPSKKSFVKSREKNSKK